MTTPFEVTALSVTLKAAGIVPSANNRFPAPNVTGNILSQKASTKSCLRSVCTRLALPYTCKSGPFCCLILLIFSATSPLKNTDGFHSWAAIVFEATYLVAVLTAGQISLCCGQNFAQMSKVLRPINRSNGMFICFFMVAPETGVHPPYRKPHWYLPPAPGACWTPSREKNSSTLLDFIVPFSIRSIPPSDGSQKCCCTAG